MALPLNEVWWGERSSVYMKGSNIFFLLFLEMSVLVEKEFGEYLVNVDSLIIMKIIRYQMKQHRPNTPKYFRIISPVLIVSSIIFLILLRLGHKKRSVDWFNWRCRLYMIKWSHDHLICIIRNIIPNKDGFHVEKWPSQLTSFELRDPFPPRDPFYAKCGDNGVSDTFTKYCKRVWLGMLESLATLHPLRSCA